MAKYHLVDVMKLYTVLHNTNFFVNCVINMHVFRLEFNKCLYQPCFDTEMCFILKRYPTQIISCNKKPMRS